jgi:hypothetical protein
MIKLFFVVRRHKFKDNLDKNIDWVGIPLKELNILAIQATLNKAKQQLIDPDVDEYEYWIEEDNGDSLKPKKILIGGKTPMDYFNDDGKPLEVL